MNPQTEPSNATRRQSVEIGAIEGLSEGVQDDGFGKKSNAAIHEETTVIECSFCENKVSTDAAIQVTLYKNKELIPPQAERICFACAEFTKLTVNNFVSKMNCQDWKKSPEFRTDIANLSFGRASPPDIIIGFLHRKKICNYCEPPKHIPLMETEHDHFKKFHGSNFFICCNNFCERFINKGRRKKAPEGQLVLEEHERKCQAHKELRQAEKNSQKYRILDADGKIIQQSFSCPIKDCRRFCRTDVKLLLHFRVSNHFWVPLKENARRVIQTEEANGVCASHFPQGTIPLRCVHTNCEFCDALVLISETIEVSNPKEFEGKPIFICTGCAEKTKLTVENMADVFNCHEWTMSEKLRFFIHSMGINYGLDGVNPGAVLGFVYKRRECNICHMHLTMHQTIDQHFQKHHSNSENLRLVACSICSESIIQRGYEMYRHHLRCGLYCVDCSQRFPEHSLHYKNNHFEIGADGKCVEQVFVCPAPGCNYIHMEDSSLIRHLEASNYFWKLMPKSDQNLNELEIQFLPNLSILDVN